MELRDIDLNLLVLLDALLQESSVTRAAARLGMSAPAMSHALRRVRAQLGDPVLVRAGRGMVLSARGELLKPRVRALTEALCLVMSPATDLDPSRFTRHFKIRVESGTLALLGPAFDAAVRTAAPNVTLEFVPDGDDTSLALSDGHIDAAIGDWPDLHSDLCRKHLYDDPAVCALRASHPTPGDRLSLTRFAALEHLKIAPHSRLEPQIDALLTARDHTRSARRIAPDVPTALMLLSMGDCVLTLSERLARHMAPRLGLKLLKHPLPLPSASVALYWHPRLDGDPAQLWLRETLTAASADPEGA
jgi:DNA-binding transcriptional LysR family regulator